MIFRLGEFSSRVVRPEQTRLSHVFIDIYYLNLVYQIFMTSFYPVECLEDAAALVRLSQDFSSVDIK